MENLLREIRIKQKILISFTAEKALTELANFPHPFFHMSKHYKNEFQAQIQLWVGGKHKGTQKINLKKTPKTQPPNPIALQISQNSRYQI